MPKHQRDMDENSPATKKVAVLTKNSTMTLAELRCDKITINPKMDFDFEGDKKTSTAKTVTNFNRKTLSSTEETQIQDITEKHQRALIVPENSSTTTELHCCIIPIAKIKMCDNWTIQGKVMFKSDVQKFSTGSGKFFTFNFSDDSGQIRITVFNKDVDIFFLKVKKFNVYQISNAKLQRANRDYSTVNNDYEIILKNYSTIVLCEKITMNPKMHFDFVPIDRLMNRNPKDIIDVIGICLNVEEVTEIRTKSGQELCKRNIILVDNSCKQIRVTLWGEQAETFNGTSEPIVAIKSAWLSNYGGRSLSASFSSTIVINPEIAETSSLKTWYDNNKTILKIESLTQIGSDEISHWKTLKEMKNAPEGQTEWTAYYKVMGEIIDIQPDNCIYKACTECNTKVTKKLNDYYCEKCKDITIYNYRFILKFTISDSTDIQWVTCFDKTAEMLIGYNAHTMSELRDTDEASFKEIFQKVTSTKHVFFNKVKLELYNNKPRLQTTVIKILPETHSRDDLCESPTKD